MEKLDGPPDKDLTHPDSDDLGDLAPSSLQNGLEVLAALLRLVCNRARRQFARAVGGDLPSDPDLPRGFDGLTVRAGGCGRCESSQSSTHLGGESERNRGW